MAQPKRSETTIVQELLAFVQNKLDVMDELSLEQICKSSFTEEDILNAKKILADTVTTACRIITRRRDRDGQAVKKDLYDIFRVLKETDPDDVPTYVARDLSRLPPVTWDHVDVTRFMKDILQLRAEVADIRKKLEDSERNVVELNKEVTALRNAKAIILPPTSSQRVNVDRASDRCNISPVSKTACTTDTVSRAAARTIVAESASSQPVTSPALPSSRPPLPTRALKKNYAQACLPSPASGSTSSKQTSAKATTDPAIKKKVDEDGFTVVSRKRSRQRNRTINKRGTATCETALKAVEPTFTMYLSRVDPSANGEDVHTYVRKRLGEATSVVQLQRLESSVRTTNFKSYLLRAPVKHKAALLSPGFWPAGLVFRRYWEASRVPGKSQLK